MSTDPTTPADLDAIEQRHQPEKGDKEWCGECGTRFPCDAVALVAQNRRLITISREALSREAALRERDARPPSRETLTAAIRYVAETEPGTLAHADQENGGLGPEYAAVAILEALGAPSVSGERDARPPSDDAIDRKALRTAVADFVADYGASFHDEPWVPYQPVLDFINNAPSVSGERDARVAALIERWDGYNGDTLMGELAEALHKHRLGCVSSYGTDEAARARADRQAHESMARALLSEPAPKGVSR